MEKKRRKIMFCKNCGANLNPTDKFCQNCGAPVPAGQTTPPPPPVYAVPPTQPVYPSQPVYAAPPVNPAPVPGYGYGPMDPIRAQKVQTAQRMLAKYRGKWVFPCIAFFVCQVLALIFYIVGTNNYDIVLYSVGSIFEALSGLFFLLWLIFAIILNANKKIIRRNGQ